jgi:AraC-like DNA-binding protein
MKRTSTQKILSIQLPSDDNPLNAQKDFTVFTNRVSEDFFSLGKLDSHFTTDFYSVIRVIKGTFQSSVNLNLISAKVNDLVILSPNDLVQLVTKSDDLILEGLTFTTSFLNKIPFLKEVSDALVFFGSSYKSHWKISVVQGNKYSHLIKKIARRIKEEETEIYAAELFTLSFTEFLFEICRLGALYLNTSAHQYGRQEKMVLKFYRLALEFYAKEKKLLFYSNHLFVTPKYLSEVVKNVTGSTAGNIIDQIVAQEARRLFQTTDLDIAEISDFLGYSNPAFFSRFFKRMVGETPRLYQSKIVRHSLSIVKNTKKG